MENPHWPALVRGLEIDTVETEGNIPGLLTRQTQIQEEVARNSCTLGELKCRAGSQTKRELAVSEDAGTILYRHLNL